MVSSGGQPARLASSSRSQVQTWTARAVPHLTREALSVDDRWRLRLPVTVVTQLVTRLLGVLRRPPVSDENILHMVSPCQGGGSMPPVADLLRRALQEGDEYGRTRIRSQHLSDEVFADLVKQTYQHALEYAVGEPSDEWLIFREGIAPWWREAAGLTDEESRRLLPGLRTDVVKRLADQDLAYRQPPKSPLLYVRRDAI